MKKALCCLLLCSSLSPGLVWAEEAATEAVVVEAPAAEASAAPAAVSAPALVVDDEIEALPAQGEKKKGNPMLTILAWSIMVAAAGFGAVVASRRRGGINPPGKKGNPLF